MPCITKSGLVHVHVLLKKAEWKELKRRAGKRSISLTLRSLIAEALGNPAGIALASSDDEGRYQADNS